MSFFQRVLVGVDPQAYFSHVEAMYRPSTEAAIASGIWLARKNRASLHFISVVEVSEQEAFLEELDWGVDTEWTVDTEQRLDAMVRQAEAEGVQADYSLVTGRGWVEIIRRAEKHHHDLVIVGTHHRGSLSNVLLGSTGIKLLRKCPCPVWIAQPAGHDQLQSVLVADDLSHVSDKVLEIGLSMADQIGAQLHLLHVLELGIGRREWDSYRIRKHLRERATQKLDQQLTNVGASVLEHAPKVEISVGAPGPEILQYVDKHRIDLLVMGTLARWGVEGVLTGNTAEHLLPRLSCSMLAVKPDNFVSPIVI